MHFTFDWTINLPTLIAIVGWVVSIFLVWLKQRDFNRDILVLLGKRIPRDDRSGILGDLATLSESFEIQTDLVELHHRHLGLDRRQHSRRQHLPPT